MSFTLTTENECIYKGGANANSTLIADTTILGAWCDEAEALISLVSRYDWVSNYSSLNAFYKKVLSEAVSSMVGMMIITYDMSGYTSRSEAQTMLDVLDDKVKRAINLLQNQEYVSTIA